LLISDHHLQTAQIDILYSKYFANEEGVLKKKTLNLEQRKKYCNGVCYRAMLTDFLWPCLDQNMNIENVWFRQDITTCFALLQSGVGQFLGTKCDHQ